MTRIAAALLAWLSLAGCQAPVRPVAPPAATAAPSAVAPVARPVPAAAAKPPVAATPAAAPPAPPAPLTGAALFDRLRARLADPPCVEDRVVQRWERIFARSGARFGSHLETVLPLLALVLDALEDHHLPSEYALLPIVESWYRPDAGAPRSAYGMWQFTSATARHFGLRVGGSVDERLMPQRATHAAVRYLAGLQNTFGDWKLANMAFNAGEYRLKRALARLPEGERRVSAAGHRPPGLAMTTYEHVAKMQALACLLAHPERFGLGLPGDTQVVPLQSVRVPAGIGSLQALAEHAGVDPAYVRTLNPAWRRALAPGAPVLLPRPGAERLGAFSLAAARLALVAPKAADAPSPAATAAAAREHRVVGGDTLGAIAQRHGVALADLLRWNGLDRHSLIHPGQRLRLEP